MDVYCVECFANATAIVRVGGMGWLKPSQVFAITDRRDIGLYGVPMLIS